MRINQQKLSRASAKWWAPAAELQLRECVLVSLDIASSFEATTPQFEYPFDSRFQLRVAELASHTDEGDHSSGSTLASMPRRHQLPDPVITLGPSALCPPLRQPRKAPGFRSRTSR